MYEIYADGKLLFSTKYSTDPNYSVLAPKVDFSEIGRAGSCSFTMLPGHPLYDSLQEKKTNILVKANDAVIFKGCVASATKDFYNQKEVQCEGDLTYLSRSQVRPSKFTKTAEDLFRYYISEHNKRVEANHQFTVGMISNDNSKTNVTLDESSFQDTKSAIEGNLIDYYGGYLRTRDQNGVSYIDWIKNYNRKSTQVINFGENLLDLSQSISPDDVFSVLIPIGQDGLTITSVNNGKDYLEVEGAIAKWGRIEKTVDFSNISDPAKLKDAGQKYISTNYDGSPISITLMAINLAHAGVNVDDIFIGDWVRLISKPHGLDKEYMCVSVSYDLYSPDKTSYTFGKKIQELTRRYTQNARSTSSAISEARSSAGRGTAAVNNKLDQYITATDNTLTLQHENIMLNAQNIALNAEQIALRATKEEANALGNRISTVEIDLNGDDTTIGLKAELRQTIDDLDGLDSRLSRAEIDINGAEGTIGLKTMVAENREWLKKNDGTLDVLDRRLSTAEIDINGGEGTIGLKTSVSTLKKDLDDTTKNVTSIDSRLAQAEIDINGGEGTIGLKGSVEKVKTNLDATNQNVTGIDSRLAQAEIDINGGEGTIGLKAKIESTISKVNENTGDLEEVFKRVGTAEINIDANKGLIEQKASMESVSALQERVHNAEIIIDAQKGEISLKADKTVTDKLSGRVDTAEASIRVNTESITQTVKKGDVISSINQTAESITISASKVNLSGYVTASQLQATDAKITNLTSGNTVASSLVCLNLQVNRRSLSWKTMTVVNSFTQASGEASTGDSYVLAGSSIPGPTSYTPEAGTTITF